MYLENNNKEKGITLIALVVTIIVLVTISVVSINMLMGENGIITRAKEAKEQDIIGKEQEILNLAYSSCKLNHYDDANNINAEELKKEITNNGGSNIIVSGSKVLEVLFSDTNHKYYITQER